MRQDARGFVWGDQAAFQFLFAELAPQQQASRSLPEFGPRLPLGAQYRPISPLDRRGHRDGNFASRSLHGGGVHAVLADGSVRFVADNIALATWRALLTIGTGETIADF